MPPMDFLLKWLLFTGVQIAATMSPGPAFAMTVRSALAHDRRAGLFTALGLGLGVGAHVVFVLCGITVILARSEIIFTLVKYAGAAYLVFAGIKSLQARARSAEPSAQQAGEATPAPISPLRAIRAGLLTNLLNPKAFVYFTAVFTQFIEPGTPPAILTLFGLTSVAVEILWFSLLTLVLTDTRIKARFLAVSHWIERACGGLLIALGIRLAFSKIH
jgi:RhtB (resistance to homoserine/threonine) family protein